MHPTAGFCGLGGGTRQRRRRGLPRKRRRQPVEPREVKATPRSWRAEPSRRPLLVIDGDFLAHRSYHALPKRLTQRRQRGWCHSWLRQFTAAVHADERPRAIIVWMGKMNAPTKRHEMFPAYQSGHEFDEELIEQLNIYPQFVAAFGFANASPGFEANDFLAAAVAAEERAGGTAVVASGDRDAFQPASSSTTILYPSRGGELARIGPEKLQQGYGVDPKQVPDFIALRVTLLTMPDAPEVGQSAPLNCYDGTAPSMGSLMHSVPNSR